MATGQKTKLHDHGESTYCHFLVLNGELRQFSEKNKVFQNIRFCRTLENSINYNFDPFCKHMLKNSTDMIAVSIHVYGKKHAGTCPVSKYGYAKSKKSKKSI